MYPSIRLYSAYYKEFPLRPRAPYVTPICAGKHAKLDMISDDTGDNIADKNALYSELTAAYWIMKNAVRDTDAWGLCHYRRYLIEDRYKLFFKKKSRYYFKTSQKVLDSLLTPELYTLLQQLLSSHDVIVQRPSWAMKKSGKIYTIEEAYKKMHIAGDWEIAMQVVREKYPAYAESIRVWGKQTKMSYNNVMIARWDVWDAYLTWLFDILFEVEKHITPEVNTYQSRVSGFLAERLMNLFILHNKLRPAYLTLGLFED